MLRAIGQSFRAYVQIRISGQAERTVANEEGETHKLTTYSRKKFNDFRVDNFNREIQKIEESLKNKSLEPQGKKPE